MILVLRDGRLVDRGTHAELPERGGRHRVLYERQFNPREERHPPASSH